MRELYQKRIALLCVAVLIVLGLIPAFCPPENETLKKDCPFCKTLDQLVSGLNPTADVHAHLGCIKAPVSLGALRSLPIVLISTPETRAPPA